MNKRNLILGVVRGYNFEQLRSFVLSLKRTGFSGDFILLHNSLSQETLASLEAHGVKLEYFAYRGSGALNSWSRFWPVLGPFARLSRGALLPRKVLKKILPLQTARFFACHDFLLNHRDEYQNVLITDVRDVVFQADPFTGFRGGLVAYEEDHDVKLADELQCNAQWVESLFGPDALEEIGQNPILCSGTIMADLGSMIAFLQEFELLILKCRNISIGGGDQGMYNYLCRGKMKSRAQVSQNGCDQVLTMIPTLKWGEVARVLADGTIVNANGSTIPVLHQYDRHPAIRDQILHKLLNVG